jgi:hypothetical protein
LTANKFGVDVITATGLLYSFHREYQGSELSVHVLKHDLADFLYKHPALISLGDVTYNQVEYLAKLYIFEKSSFY